MTIQASQPSDLSPPGRTAGGPAVTQGPIGAAWHPVARLDELVDPLRPLAARLLGEEIVVIGDPHDPTTVAALPGRCPHRGTALAGGRVVGGCVECPYHGWRFDRTGRCDHIPAMPDGPIPPAAHLVALATTVRHGLVWAAFDRGADSADVPWFPEPGAIDDMRVVIGAPMTWRTSAGRHLENILDLAHFPFVHPATFGCVEAHRVAPHAVETTRHGIATSVKVMTRNPDTPDGPLYAGLGPTIELGYHYRVELPYRITLEFDFPDGMRRALHEVITPVASDECRIHWALLVDARLDSSDDDERAFAHAVFDEDRPVIESQPPGVPVSASAEVHLPSDRLAVAYRRALREAGVPDHALV